MVLPEDRIRSLLAKAQVLAHDGERQQADEQEADKEFRSEFDVLEHVQSPESGEG